MIFIVVFSPTRYDVSVKKYSEGEYVPPKSGKNLSPSHKFNEPATPQPVANGNLFLGQVRRVTPTITK